MVYARLAPREVDLLRHTGLLALHHGRLSILQWQRVQLALTGFLLPVDSSLSKAVADVREALGCRSCGQRIKLDLVRKAGHANWACCRGSHSRQLRASVRDGSLLES